LPLRPLTATVYLARRKSEARSAFDLDAGEFVVRRHVGEDHGVVWLEAREHLDVDDAGAAKVHLDAFCFLANAAQEEFKRLAIAGLRANTQKSSC